MELVEWKRLAGWVTSVWPAPGCDDDQVKATYFLVSDLDRADAEAALREHALSNGVVATPHASEIRQLTSAWVRSRRPRPVAVEAVGEDVVPADDEFVNTLLADLRADLGRRPYRDPLALDRSPATDAARARIGVLRAQARDAG